MMPDRFPLEPKTAPRGIRIWPELALVVLAATVPYLGTLDAPLVFDDVKLVAENEMLRVDADEAVERFVASFDVLSREFDDEAVRENYRPLRFLSYWVDYRLSRAWLGPFPPERPPVLLFHLQNILWHVLNSILVLAIGRRLLGPGLGGLALALLFAAHPLQTEAVTYISGRRDVLSTFFFLAALMLHLGARRDARVTWTAVIGVPVLYGLGLFAKEMVITLPAVLLLVDLARRARVEPRRVLCHLVTWGVAAFFVWATLSNERLIAEPVAAGGGWVALDACRYVARYAGLLIAPVSQSIDYSFDAIPATEGWLRPWTTAPAVALVVALVASGLLGLARRRIVPAVGALWFVGVLVPVLQIVPIPERFAERFAYLPSIGLLLVGAGLIASWARRSPLAARAALAVLVVVLGGRAIARNGDWSTRLALWESATTAQPRCARAWIGYGEALQLAESYEDAEAAYGRALDILSTEADPPPLRVGHALRARTARGGVRFALGQLDRVWLPRAEADLREVLASRDSDGQLIAESAAYAVVRFDLAGVLLSQGRVAEAEAEYRELIRVGGPPGAASRAWYQVAQIQLASGEQEAAARTLERVIETMPTGDESRVRVAMSLAKLLVEALQDYDAAWEVLAAASEHDPTREERIALLLLEAQVLDKRGQVDACVARLERALDVDPRNEAVLLSLAGIELNRGRRERAGELYARVLRQSPGHRQALQGLNQLRLRQDVDGQTSVENADAALRDLAAGAARHEEKGELPAARQAWDRLREKAAELGRPQHVVAAYHGIARVESLLGRERAAEHALTQALKLDAERWRSWRLLGDLQLARLDAPLAARDSYLRYLDSLPPAEEPDPRVLLNLGRILAKIDPAEALDRYLEARRRGIAEAAGVRMEDVEREIGILEAQLGRWQEAFDTLSAWLERHPGAAVADREAVRRLLDEEVLPALLGVPPGATDDVPTPPVDPGGGAEG